MKKRRLMLLIGIFLLGISTVYAVTIIRASDVTYDNSKSKGNSSNVQGAIDELYSLSDGSCSSGSISSTKNNLINYITNLAKTDTTNLAYDDTEDKNLRYIGSEPNNYVLFNNELWRIIGIMNNVEDSEGNKASRIKIIRADSIGEYAWDNRGTYGSNDWTTSTLMKTLNEGPYWNKTSGACYKGNNGASVSCDFSSNGLSDTSKKMITNIVWNLGGRQGAGATANTFYKDERSSTVYKGRATEWTGYVGLMYPSDYGYAVGENVRSSCLNIHLGSNDGSFISCVKNIWLHNDTYKWTITQQTETNYGVIQVNGNGWVGSWYAKDVYYRANYSYNVHPVVYLNTNIRRVSGGGTSDDPYIITDKVQNDKDTSNASPPKLDEDGKLIPVTLANDGKVTMVSEDDEGWYNYGEKKWANAIILIDSPSKTYKEGDIILESDIESYFVWIPKYKYKLWNTGTTNKKVHEIEVVFDTTDTVDEDGVSCKTPMTSGNTGNCNNGEYMTHPAFISLGVDGFWVGKFETGYKGATSTETAQVNSNDSSKIIIKPNAYSWRSNTVYNFFTSAYNYERNLDSHMMKNTEWGAVAYLSHSKYGSGYEVNINNNSSFKTGNSSLLTIDQHSNPGTYGDGKDYNLPYNTEIGYLASTTGNITGVYDTSGGAHEYMASYIDGNYGASGFTSNTLSKYNSKYYDVYNTKSTTTSYQYRILGDATGEMGPFSSYLNSEGGSMWHSNWYADAAYFVETDNPWFRRGAYYGDGDIAGLFCFSWYTGGAFNRLGSRIVLSP